MATLSTSDQQVWKKVLASKNNAMTQTQIETSFPGMSKREVISCISALVKHQLFVTEKGDDSTITFHGLSAEHAKQKATLTSEQMIVLKAIGHAGNKGIAVKSLRAQLGPDAIPATTIRKIVDGFEKDGQVKAFKGVNAPTVALYCLPHLDPPEEITGGIWFDTTKEYDAELVDTIHTALLHRVRKLTFHKKPKDAKALIPSPLQPAARTSRLPTPHALMHWLNISNVTTAKLGVKHVMECMRALELDGLVEAVKPLGGVQVPEVGRDGDGRMSKRQRLDDEHGDGDEWSQKKERERLKAKERLKEKKRREREKEKEREKARKKAKEKEKEKERAKKRKRREKDKKDRKKHKKKRTRLDSDEINGSDSDPLVSILDEDATVKEKKTKKKGKHGSSAASSSSSSIISASSSPSSASSSDDSDPGSESEDSVSSVASSDLDAHTLRIKPKSSAGFAAAHSQSLTFSGAGLQDLSDTAIVYRATNRFTIPLGQTQAPCGKCPQFTFCEEQGPVNAESCMYFEDWLGDRVGGWDADARRGPQPEDMEKVEVVENGDDEEADGADEQDQEDED